MSVFLSTFALGFGRKCNKQANYSVEKGNSRTNYSVEKCNKLIGYSVEKCDGRYTRKDGS